MRIIFLGTPDFASPSLQALIDAKNHKNNNDFSQQNLAEPTNFDCEVVGVVCQPDRIANRGVVKVSPVKELALKHNIPVFQFENISADGEETLKNLKPDLMITCAYGQILKQNILDIAPIFNIHASLLPKYRGASPIQWSLINGEKQTGITIIKTQLGLDNGPKLFTSITDIKDEETASMLFDRLALLGAKTIISALNLYNSGNYSLQPQDESLATTYKTLKKIDGLVDFSKPATDVYNFYRGVTLWPSCYAFLDDKMLKFNKLSKTDFFIKERRLYLPGTIIKNGFDLYLVCKDNSVLKIEQLQLEGGKSLSAKDFINGRNFDNIELKGKEV